jgi:ribosomal protein L30/L7E
MSLRVTDLSLTFKNTHHTPVVDLTESVADLIKTVADLIITVADFPREGQLS